MQISTVFYTHLYARVHIHAHICTRARAKFNISVNLISQMKKIKKRQMI